MPVVSMSKRRRSRKKQGESGDIVLPETRPAPLAASPFGVSPLVAADDSANRSSGHVLQPFEPARLSGDSSSEFEKTKVKYVAQLDFQSFATRKSKVGKKISYIITLHDLLLSVFRDMSAPAKFVVNVRDAKVKINVPDKELTLMLPEKDRRVRFFLEDQNVARQWKTALEGALHSDIADFYTLGRSIGSGAYGEVVEGFDIRTQQKYAIKIVHRTSNLKSRQHLEQEMEVMKTVSHPHIIRTFHIFNLRRSIYIVMEHMSGGDLFDFIAEHDSLTEGQAVQVIASIFKAVDYLHRQRIVHRDLKPENILCVEKKWPVDLKVTDFGFSSFLDPNLEDDNIMKTPVGTAYFMAPEILTSQGHGPAVDCFSCGVILYTILTGRLPFAGVTTNEYFNNVRAGNVKFPPSLWKGISQSAQNLVRGLLNTDPYKRLTAFAALQHNWIVGNSEFCKNAIRRDRSNLHSKNRRLQKARASVIAVAMMQKVKALHEMHYGLDKVPDVVDAVGEGVKKTVEKTADGIEWSVRKTGEGMKKASDNIERGVKLTGEGVKRAADGIGEGVKKTANGIETGIKKTADGFEQGIKKTIDGIEVGVRKTGEGVKKTAGGIEKGFKKTGEGVKKAADEIGDGVKKTADGIGNGVKKTAGGLGNGIKKTGQSVRKGGEKIRARTRRTDSSQATNDVSVAQSENMTTADHESSARSSRSQSHKNDVVRRGKGPALSRLSSVPENTSGTASVHDVPDISHDITPSTAESRPDAEEIRAPSQHENGFQSGEVPPPTSGTKGESSASEYWSADEDLRRARGPEVSVKPVEAAKAAAALAAIAAVAEATKAGTPSEIQQSGRDLSACFSNLNSRAADHEQDERPQRHETLSHRISATTVDSDTDLRESLFSAHEIAPETMLALSEENVTAQHHDDSTQQDSAVLDSGCDTEGTDRHETSIDSEECHSESSAAKSGDSDNEVAAEAKTATMLRARPALPLLDMLPVGFTEERGAVVTSCVGEMGDSLEEDPATLDTGNNQKDVDNLRKVANLLLNTHTPQFADMLPICVDNGGAARHEE